MDKWTNNKGTDVGGRDGAEEGKETDKQTGISYQEVIERLTRNKKVMAIVISLCLMFLIGYFVGFPAGFANAQSLVKDCLVYG